jgi:putative tricarboxylic transport membrane protein
VIWYAKSFPKLEEGYPGPSLFPTVLAVLFIAAGVVLIFQDIRSRSNIFKFDISELTRAHLINIALILSAIIFYILVSDFLGFQFTSFIVLFALMKRLRVPTVWSLSMACGVTFGIYVLFAKILLVPLPWGLWGW